MYTVFVIWHSALAVARLQDGHFTSRPFSCRRHRRLLVVALSALSASPSGRHGAHVPAVRRFWGHAALIWPLYCACASRRTARRVWASSALEDDFPPAMTPPWPAISYDVLAETFWQVLKNPIQVETWLDFCSLWYWFSCVVSIYVI
jgi:hypothetical protein